MLNYIVWNFEPRIFPNSNLYIAWYGVCFALGVYLCYLIVSYAWKKEGKSEVVLNKVVIWLLVALIVGARLGHCLFYEPEYDLSNPLEILKTWKGGLASHGGAIGILIGLLIYAKKVKKSYLWILDRIVIPTSIGGAFIRIGNLMNSEIYGYETTLPWGFKFVRDWAPGTPLDVIPACHPTQIYEALVCVIVFVVLMYLYFRKDTAYKHPGFFFGLFCTAIFGSRILIEFIKQPQVEFESSMTLDMGQWLSIPFVIAGIFFIVRSYKQVRS